MPSRYFINLLVTALVMIWSFLILGEGMVNPTLHNDEGAYIGKGWSFLEFSNRESPVWESFDAYDQPALTGYLYGWWLNKESGADPNFFYDFCFRYPACDFEKAGTNNLYLIFSPGGILQQTVLKTRVLSFLATWLMMGLLLLISWVIFNRLLLGTVWVILLLTNPTFVFEMTRAKPDSFLLFGLVLLIFLIALWLKHRPGLGKNLAMFIPVLFGILIGLTTSIKLNGAMGFILLSGVTFEMVRAKELKVTQAVKLLIATLMTAWVVFVLVNPYTWKDPIKRTAFFFEYRQEITKKLEAESREAYLGNWRERFPSTSYGLIARRGTGLLGFLYRYRKLQGSIAILSLAFFMIEMFAKNKPHHQRAVFLMLLLLAIINYFYLSLDWLRYYLPLMLALSFAISLFTTAVAKKLYLELTGIFFSSK